MGHQAKLAGVSQGKRSSGDSWALKEMLQQGREKMERDLYADTYHQVCPKCLGLSDLSPAFTPRWRYFPISKYRWLDPCLGVRSFLTPFTSSRPQWLAWVSLLHATSCNWNHTPNPGLLRSDASHQLPQALSLPTANPNPAWSWHFSYNSQNRNAAQRRLSQGFWAA